MKTRRVAIATAWNKFLSKYRIYNYLFQSKNYIQNDHIFQSSASTLKYVMTFLILCINVSKMWFWDFKSFWKFKPIMISKVSESKWSPLALLLIRLPFPGDPPRGTLVISGVWYGRCVHTDSGVVGLEKDSRQSPSPNNQVTNIYLYMLYCSLNCRKVGFGEVTNSIHDIAHFGK